MALRSTVLVFISVSLLAGIEAVALDGLVIPTNPFYKPQLNIDNESLLESCAQFSGDWQGHCDGVEGKKEIQMKIDQKECQTLTVDGQVFPIDGMETGGNHQGSSMSNETTALNWDPDRNKIIGNTQSIGQRLGKRKTLKYQYKSKFSLERDQSQLLLKTEAFVDTFVNDFKRVEKSETTCKLEKKIETTKTK